MPLIGSAPKRFCETLESNKMGGDTTLKLACAGLTSAGKSTLINSLVGARLLETGVCRTTSEPCVISAEYSGPYACEWKRPEADLPGVADAVTSPTSR
jgi:hypothetical protein